MSRVKDFFKLKKIKIFSFFCIVICRTHFNLLPYELVKPILDSATPEQLNLIIDNNAVKKKFFFFHFFIIFSFI